MLLCTVYKFLLLLQIDTSHNIKLFLKVGRLFILIIFWKAFKAWINKKFKIHLWFLLHKLVVGGGAVAEQLKIASLNLDFFLAHSTSEKSAETEKNSLWFQAFQKCMYDTNPTP